ncbi:MAG: glycogen synthase, partial [Planctomycetaceae bacterium]|nr:glycogen synthase [Planctomycetaceae bacterium]
MRILFTSSEAVPFAKTGGLADVTSALPKALHQMGHDVTLMIPYYPRQIAKGTAANIPITDLGISIDIPIRSDVVTGRLLESHLPQSDVRIILVDCAEYFDREGLYVSNGRDYIDNCERFVFFSRAVLQAAKELNLRPEIVHANDWQTGLVPALLQIEERGKPSLGQTASVFTIHNLAFQGMFWHFDMPLTGLDWKYFNYQQMEFHGKLNLLKTGIVFSDQLTTVSPSYAQEIQTPEYGCGLDGVLAGRRPDLTGILNGIDLEVWNPETDSALPSNYNVETWQSPEGKPACKKALQRELQLPEQDDVPLFGMISRMTEQKGFDLLRDKMHEFLKRDIQFCFLGTGEPQIEIWLKDLAERYPNRVAVRIEGDESLAHRIEAGSDAYLMPSRFEPCGLNEMYSLRYGTVPIVHGIGGLADTVVDA